MKTLKLYWLRFKSQTPQMLKNIQKVLLAISAGAGGAIVVMEKYDMGDSALCTFAKYACVACAFAVPILQFATSDKQLQDTTPDAL